ncbi:MAG: hypothetical protein GEU90_10290 [Gemmatimonas sp.]|nr:hypothetical protein [Gemmatimonas sp.]
MAQNDRAYDYDEEEEVTYGLALGFRILEDGGKLFLAEAEIAPYVDEPDELGVTLVFHPLDGVDPVDIDEATWPSWPIDVDDGLVRHASDSLAGQFASIIRQLRDLSEPQLREYLQVAREDAEKAN